ncbi:proton-conducting transporter transmembrane domain-containing protein [Thermococcus gammatolerans]|uniref:Formate hydrogenlyase I subunit D (Mhy1D) n=1 Tax=Thermococcus gammatolerans (strain DSM 15229 / JCM 11827 / EJ3) TaxID=593117 RepID=C5A3D6_THEGJ|nr:proton-conducting transporter membrane subunit [Thermococcus gammatolerans]ACS32748.1 formate hydrogenlyase I subunit D (Mhy1D) [Thermococcus gammatolerans EJ3]
MFLEYAIIAFIIGGVIGLVRDYRVSVKASSFMAFLGSLALLGEVYHVYTNGPEMFSLFGIPMNVSGLSNVFLLIIGIVGVAASLFAINYMDLFEKTGKGWVYAIAYNTFLASMTLVVTVDSMEYFVMSWELMTLSSFILVFFSEKARDVNASVKYYITMHFLDTIPLFLALGTAYSLIGNFEELTFENIGAALSTHHTSRLVFAGLLMIAFTAKAGLFPFSFWVAETYRAAPSHVSAIMAGAMEKMALYGILALVWKTAGIEGDAGIIVALAGMITITYATLYALRENNAKRLLAYSSISQMGYIWLGIGIGMVLVPKGGFLGTIGALGAFAGLFHALNHAIFKASLFLSAGAVEYRTGTVDLNELGGLGRRMKFTALAALFASLAISGVPPFNGFISKWLIYVSGYSSSNPLLIFGAVLAVFFSAGTLAYSMKFYGAQFGGEMKRYENVEEVPAGMLLGQWILAGLTLIIGVFPRIVVPILNEPFNAPLTENIYRIGFGSVLFSPVIFVILLGALAAALYLTFKPEFGKETKPWDCGSTEIDEDEYRTNAEGYYNWYEKKIGSFYRLGDWFYTVGAGVIHYITRAYLWMASYFTKVVDTPYTKVETLDDLREREIMNIDEEALKPLLRLLRIVKNVLPGMRLGTFVVLTLVVIGAVIGILIAL